MCRSLLLTVAAISLMAGPARACDLDLVGSSGQWAPQIKFPHLLARIPASFNSIVGVWQVSYSVNGTVVLNTIDTWSSDGDEFLIAGKNPVVGNVCAGVWKSANARTVQLHHIGWTFDTTGTLTGTLVDDELVTLNRRATAYAGTFDEKFYDLSGNLVKEVSGDNSATRVIVQ